MTPATSLFSPATVSPNAFWAFRGIWWLTSRRFFSIRYWSATVALLAVLTFFAFWAVPANATSPVFVSWVSSFYLSCLVPIFAFLSGAGALRDDLKPGSGDYLFTRPVRRPLYFAFRVVAQILCLLIDFLLACGTVASVAWLRKVPGLMDVLPALLLGQCLSVISFAALGFLCGVLTSRYVIVGLVYGAVVEIALGNLPTQINKLALTKHILSLLRRLLPKEMPSKMDPTILSAGVSLDVAWILAFSIVVLLIAALIFSQQERSGSRPQEG